MRTFKELTRLEQTFFGLPLLLAGALLPFIQREITLSWSVLWIFPAFLLARISGMAFNQVVDRAIDAKNPRTLGRPIPTGRVSELQAKRVAWLSLVLFLVVCAQINLLCVLLAPLAAFLLFSYSYLKRITPACHFVLGFIHLLSPVMASIAVSGTILPSAIALGVASALLFAGSDIIYALQDLDFDREMRLFSIPAWLGREKSLFVARLCHLFSVVVLLAVGVLAHLPLLYFLSTLVVALTFFRFHKAALSEGAFFRCNTLASFCIFGGIFASFVWDVM